MSPSGQFRPIPLVHASSAKPQTATEKADIQVDGACLYFVSNRGVRPCIPNTECKRVPWRKGKLIGPRPQLRQKHVWAIRTRLQIDQQTLDLALFNLAIDSKLRGCDLVAVKVDDVARNGHTVERVTVRRKKTGRPVRFELTEQTRQAINDYSFLGLQQLAVGR